MMPCRDRVAETTAEPPWNGFEVGAASTEACKVWGVPSQTRPPIDPVPVAIPFPAACSTVTKLLIAPKNWSNGPQVTVTGTETSTREVSFACDPNVIPTAAAADGADTKKAASTNGRTSALRHSFQENCCIDSSFHPTWRVKVGLSSGTLRPVESGRTLGAPRRLPLRSER